MLNNNNKKKTKVMKKNTYIINSIFQGDALEEKTIDFSVKLINFNSNIIFLSSNIIIQQALLLHRYSRRSRVDDILAVLIEKIIRRKTLLGVGERERERGRERERAAAQANSLERERERERRGKGEEFWKMGPLRWDMCARKLSRS
jgi:hypothetical protein